MIVGQAPGIKAQEAHMYWHDKSGDRLIDWLGMDYAQFFGDPRIAIVPMDFYFPGHGKSGDLPPRAGFAEKWHPRLRALMPQLETTLLIGGYAQHYYLKEKLSTTEAVRRFGEFAPQYFPLVHPSPRNNIWLAKNPWFESDVLPALKARVHAVLK